jgi:hypothetical protein
MNNPYFQLDDHVKDILAKYPELADFMVSQGFSHLADPEFRKVVPITLREALSHHNKDAESFQLEMIQVIKAHRE